MICCSESKIRRDMPLKEKTFDTRITEGCKTNLFILKIPLLLRLKAKHLFKQRNFVKDCPVQLYFFFFLCKLNQVDLESKHFRCELELEECNCQIRKFEYPQIGIVCNCTSTCVYKKLAHWKDLVHLPENLVLISVRCRSR